MPGRPIQFCTGRKRPRALSLPRTPRQQGRVQFLEQVEVEGPLFHGVYALPQGPAVVENLLHVVPERFIGRFVARFKFQHVI